MGQQYKRHFTPPKGWMNDPNGTIYIDGIYHLFCQYYPDDIVWGPMHWGHAVSQDLQHWQWKGIAIAPDDLGYIFSGCCVYDRENLSGLGHDGQGPLLAFYTSHNPETGEQQQSISYSLDMEHFQAYEGKPVITNCKSQADYKQDFRDPKVFRNSIKGGYTMVLAVGRILEFYGSQDLLHWVKTGSFDPAVKGFYGICECPDCFPLQVDGKQKWILSLSSILEDDKVGVPLRERGFGTPRVMQYFVGEFDGSTFVDTEQCNQPLVLDYGPDDYAMVSFADAPEPTMIGWGEHWDYVASIPASDRRGKMTLPRRVSLISTKDGYRLVQRFCEDVPVDTVSIRPGENIELTSETGILIITARDDAIIVDRKQAVNKDDCIWFEKENYLVFEGQRVLSGPCELYIAKDQGYYEILADDGTVAFSIMTY